MYEIYYNFQAEPFRLSPDHNFCFEHKGYARAGAYMAYAYRRAEGFVMITGRPGTGKTTLIGDLVESLSSDNVHVANLVCTQLQADDLLKSVAYSFEIGSANIDKAELLQRLTVLLQRWQRSNRRALLIVDEAQDLSPSAMEELRLLTNIQLDNQPLLQVFLVGQPELRDLVLRPEMEQVHQRIVAASHIGSIDAEETEGYVMHRLQVVGWKGDPSIERGIFPLIHKFSEGVPRRINLICSRLFLLGSVENRHTIEVKDVAVVIGELQTEGLAAGSEFSIEDFQSPEVEDWVPVPEGASPRAAEDVAGSLAPISEAGDEEEGTARTSAVATDGGGADVDPVSVQSVSDGAPASLPVSELPQNAPGSAALSSANAKAERAEAEVMDIPQPTDVQDAPQPFHVEEKVPSDESMSARGGEQKSDTFSHGLSSALVIIIVLLALLYVAYDVTPESFRSSISAWFDLVQAEPGSALPIEPGAR